MTTLKNPTLSTDRIEILDILRGFAVFGILLSNIIYISGFYFTPFDALENLHLADFNKTLVHTLRALVIGKAYPIFTILFGAAFFLQFSRFKSENTSFTKYFIWRMSLLFSIGLLHLIVWPGDVVNQYAILGMLLIPFRKLKSTYILIFAIVFFSMGIGMELLDQYMHRNDVHTETTQVAILQFEGIDPHGLVDTVQNDGVKGMQTMNKQQYSILFSIRRLKAALFSLMGLFLLGGFLFKSELLTKKLYNWKYLVAFIALACLGRYLSTLNFSFRFIEHVFGGLSFITILGLLYKTTFFHKCLNLFKPVGRVALTNYVMQSIIAIFIFYGVGLGYFTKIPLYGVILIAFGILAFQTVFSHLWLKHFYYGPLEWAWRSMTYHKNLSLKNRK